MTFDVQLTQQAEYDIREIYQYIKQNGPANPDHWLIKLENKFESLKGFPEGCGLAPEDEFVKLTVRQTILTHFASC